MSINFFHNIAFWEASKIIFSFQALKTEERIKDANCMKCQDECPGFVAHSWRYKLLLYQGLF